ncbi:hypothetical protein F8388_021120 [Cannabis sativa]|uniref:non-specific serine/threonine protein kinase n=1 Tax=Cannabis sativa TaxID=3483 RepID=A0A7J6EJJ5_CANSA|nr:hypothetical protein G4B88_019984 [Cannabis sativa]KAF4388290.1 hypothetical protein F8388_021120 [Cannabis sativa]
MKLHQHNIHAYSYFMYIQVIVLFFIIFLWLQLVTPAIALGSEENDHLALLEIKKGIGSDPFGVLSSWNDSTNFCNWVGVTCSRRHKRVTALELYSYKLKGSISPHIGNLSFMKLIDLSNNSFSGEIPIQVGRLFRLQYFYLTNNTFTGEIPAQLSNCSQLREIDFSRNKLVGRIPYELGFFAKLELLQLGANNLTGTIPTSVGNLSSLVHLSVPYNNLHGRIPQGIGNLKSLSIFAVGANKFSGELPSSFYNLSALTIISTASNNFNGTLPANIGLTLPNLKWLAISNNEFSGPIPISLSNASKLEAVVLSTNNFVGVVPSDLGKLIDVWWLGFGTNNLGSNSSHDLNFLTSLKNLTQIQILDFSDNQFGGVLPSTIANLSTSTLTNLYLGGNQISGPIPPILEKYTNLQVLDMARNLFVGTIPSSFGMFRNMQGMDLRRNKLFGQIPSSFGNLTQLIELYLSENKLHGRIPPSIGNCKKLQYLDISQNNLTGAIPKEVTDLSSLSLLLNLSHNSLTGSLPLEVGNLKNINQLDFSENSLSGEIPTTIGECLSLEYLNLQGNSFQGVIPSSLDSLKGLRYLDLSLNHLSGNIPKSLQTLPFLVYFNLSFNNLEGEVPTEGVFKNASAISILRNGKLCGGITKLELPACSKVRGRKGGLSHAMKLVIIISCASLGLLMLFFLALHSWRNSKSKPSSILSTKEWDPNHLSKVSYKMLHKGTSGFSPSNLIGSGSFGSVFKGTLDEDERLVAIKVFNLQRNGASKSFMSECMALRNIRHRNLVKIITSCSSLDYNGNEFKALVFEFMVNSSLEEWLHLKINGEYCSRNLNFLQRLNVAIDVASALQYLHFECEPPIIHCDLKPSNILLDDDMVAHVGDFGIARILSTTNGIPQNQASSTIGLKGSIGYAAPEYGMGGKASIQGDVYSYGILLLEMFTGKRPTDETFREGLNIHQYAKMAVPERLMQLVDPSLLQSEVEVTTSTIVEENHRMGKKKEKLEFDIEEGLDKMNENVKKCLHSVLKIGLACSVESPKERMNMGEVIKELRWVKNAFP